MPFPARSPRAAALAIFAALTLALTSCSLPTDLPDTGGVASSVTGSAAGSVADTIAAPAAASQQALDGLAVKGRAPKTGYERELFGTAWSDDVTVEFGHNGCDTRNDILRRDLDTVVIKKGTHGCVAVSGLLRDPYSGADIDFVRGQDTSRRVQIDHVVPLADAWQKGAQAWDAETRRNFANDPRNLLAVDGRLNQQKQAGDAATWLPPNRAFRCEYAQKIIEVKAAYGLWITEAEKAALSGLLDTC